MIAGGKVRTDPSQNPAYRPARVVFHACATIVYVAEIVDGNNLIGRLGGGTREGLLCELADLARAKRKKMTVVFDGPPDGGRPKVQTLGDLTVVYAAPRTGDEEILRRIQEARDPRGLTVITDDRGLQSAVRAAGARTAGIDVYRKDAEKRLGSSPTPVNDKASAPVNARDWERWFSDPKNRMSG